MKPEPGVAVIPQRAEPAEGQQTASTQKLAYAQGGFESPTLTLSGATLTSFIKDTGSEIRFSEVWGRYALRTPGAQARRWISTFSSGVHLATGAMPEALMASWIGGEHAVSKGGMAQVRAATATLARYRSFEPQNSQLVCAPFCRLFGDIRDLWARPTWAWQLKMEQEGGFAPQFEPHITTIPSISSPKVTPPVPIYADLWLFFEISTCRRELRCDISKASSASFLEGSGTAHTLEPQSNRALLFGALEGGQLAPLHPPTPSALLSLQGDFFVMGQPRPTFGLQSNASRGADPQDISAPSRMSCLVCCRFACQRARDASAAAMN